MSGHLIDIRNSIMRWKYKWILRPIFFKVDPETIHDRIIVFLRFLGKYPLTRKIAYFCWGYSSPTLEQNILGINFKNPVGLSAGFDKNAILIDIVPSLGFSFTEIGSVTGEPCSGNPKPRLWRLKKSKSIAVYYGLKNDGCQAIARRLNNKKLVIPLGVNIAKTNCQATANTSAAIEDYFKAYRTLANIGDYVAINISCPNAFGGQPFTDQVKLNALLEKIMSVPKTKPIFLKISPDLSKKEVDAIIETALQFKIDGFICTNLTKNRNNKNILDKTVPKLGGLSGKVVESLSNELISYIYKKTGKKFVIIGCGGIFTAEDAYRKIKAGASLVELITGMIFEGPQLISDINIGLVKLLKKDGYSNISQAIGRDN